MLYRITILCLLAILITGLFCSLPAIAEDKPVAGQSTITLPTPASTSKVTVDEALKLRRSIRSYAEESLTLQQVSQLLWAAQGITDPKTGHRTAPSAVAVYPLHVYLFAGNVKDLPQGVYKYIPQGHKLEVVLTGDRRTDIGSQPQMQKAPAVLVFTEDLAAFAPRFGERAQRWADIEVGHSAQNVLLEEVALGLIGVPMGGIDPAGLKTALKLGEKEQAIYAVSAAKKGAATEPAH